MPSPRRVRLLILSVLAGVVVLLFYTSQARHRIEPDKRTFGDFYKKTVDAIHHGPGSMRHNMEGDDADALDLARQGPPKAPIPGSSKPEPAAKKPGNADSEDEQLAEQMAERLRAAEQKAKDLANQKAPLKPDAPSRIVGVGSSADGQHSKDEDGAGAVASKENKKEVADSSSSGSNSKDGDTDTLSPRQAELLQADAELDLILKSAPVVIFSKSYCPFSKRAKGLLLEKYVISPAPYVVELDTHKLGSAIQEQLGRRTKRTTVPNIMINAASIGGSDELAELDKQHRLVEEVEKYGLSKVSIKERFVQT